MNCSRTGSGSSGASAAVLGDGEELGQQTLLVDRRRHVVESLRVRMAKGSSSSGRLRSADPFGGRRPATSAVGCCLRIRRCSAAGGLPSASLMRRVISMLFFTPWSEHELQDRREARLAGASPASTG